MIKSRVSKIIPVPISDKMVSEAKEKAEEMGKLNNSIRSGEGNIVGFLGKRLLKVSSILPVEILIIMIYFIMIKSMK